MKALNNNIVIRTFVLILLIATTKTPFATSHSENKLIITATHITESMLSDGLAKVIINSEQIEMLAPNSLADILRGIPGVDIIEQGGIGGLTFLSRMEILFITTSLIMSKNYGQKIKTRCAPNGIDILPCLEIKIWPWTYPYII